MEYREYDCPSCNGTGEYWDVFPNPEVLITCETCKGTKKINSKDNPKEVKDLEEMMRVLTRGPLDG